MDYSKNKAINLIQKITAENESRRQRLKQIDATRFAEIAEWEGSERIRSQIPNLHSSPFRGGSKSVPSRATASPRSPVDREKHALIMRNTMKMRQAAAGSPALQDTNHAAALHQLSLRDQTQRARQRYQNNNYTTSKDGAASSFSHPPPLMSSFSESVASLAAAPRQVSTSPKNFSHSRMRAVSQQWQSPGHVQRVHARLEKIEGEDLLNDDPFLSTEDEDKNSKKVVHVINHDLIAKTFAYARIQQQEAERLKKIQEAAQTIQVPRKLFSKLRGFLDNTRDIAFREVLGLLSMWLPTSYEQPHDAHVSSVASNKVRTDFDGRYTSATTTPPFYSVIRVDKLNHENSLDELLHRGGTFQCPASMSMVFPVGKLGLLEPGLKVSLLVCRVHPGVSFWMDEQDMPGLSREDSHVYLPSGPPEDFDSICLLGRRTKTDRRTGKRRSSLDGVGDPIDPLNEYYRYLVQEPSQRAIAMWCVTFTPQLRGAKKKETVELDTLARLLGAANSGKKGRESTESKERTDGVEEKGESTSLKNGRHGGSTRWEHRAKKKEMMSSSPNKSTFDIAAVVKSAIKKEHGRISSWEDPKETLEADQALTKFEKECGDYTRALQSKLVKLHQQLESVHRNYMSVQSEIHDDLRSSLTDVQLEKRTRKGALRAWKLQLLQTHSERSRMDALPHIAKEELTEDQCDVYHEYFDDVSTRHRTETRPPGWQPQKPPVDSSIATVQLTSEPSIDVAEEVLTEASQMDILVHDWGKTVTGSLSVAVESRNAKITTSPLSTTTPTTTTKTTKTATRAVVPPLRGPSIRVGGKTVQKKRSSIVDMMDAFKHVGGSRRQSAATRRSKSDDFQFAMQEAEYAAESSAVDIAKQFNMDGVIADDDDDDDTDNVVEGGGDEKREVEQKESKTSNVSPLKQQLRVLEVRDELTTDISPPRTPDGSPLKKTLFPGTLQTRIFKPSSPRIGGQHHNKNLSLGAGLYTISSVPKIESGWLFKKGQMLKAKKKRWFELTPNQLIYRESQTHSGKRGHMQLQRCVVRADGSDTSSLHFMVISPDRTLDLNAETTEERDKWLSALSHNISLARRHVRTANILALHHGSKQYNALDRTLRRRLEIVAFLSKHTTKMQLDSLAPSLFTIFSFRSLGSGCTLTSYCLAMEVEKTGSMSTLFRSNSLGTKLLDLVLRSGNDVRDGVNEMDQTFMEIVLPPVLTAIVEYCREDTRYGLELDNERCPPGAPGASGDDSVGMSGLTTQMTNIHVERLNKICCLCLNKIQAALRAMLPLKCAVLSQLCEDMEHQFGRGTGNKGTDKKTMQDFIVMLLFLRTINPALTNPAAATLFVESLEEDDNIHHIRRAQKMVAQILQKVANGKRFDGPSNQYLAPMNAFIDENSSRLGAMYEVIEQRSSRMEDTPAKPPLLDEEAAILYDDEDIEAFYNSLIVVHTVLTEQPDGFTKISTKQLSEFSDRAKREPGFDLVGAMIDLEVVLESLGTPTGGSKWYGGNEDVNKE
jgi:hypothetical protein